MSTSMSTPNAGSNPPAANSSTVPPTPGSRGRCFVCLVDEDPLSGEEWVTPCPCSLEGHQDCMMTYITELEQEGKPLRCPICKAPITVDEPFDPALAVGKQLHKAMSRTSPWLLGIGTGTGTVIGLNAYGHMAVRVFTGRDDYLNTLHNLETGSISAAWHFPAFPLVAPFLVLGQCVPGLGNLFFIPMAAFYSTFHMARDKNFFSWPPSPELVIAAFPYVRALYRSFFIEFVRPYERRLNRRIAGLPEPEPAQERDQHARDRANNQVGGLVGVLDAAINLLDVPEVDVDFQVQEEVIQQDNMEDGDMGHRVEIEVAGYGDDADYHAFDQFVHEEGEQQQGQADGLGQVELDPLQFSPPASTPGEEQEAGAHAEQPHDNQQQNAVRDAMPAPPPVPEPAPAEPAGANRQWNLQTSLREVSNALATALLLPAISRGAGELLRLALPKTWTALAKDNKARPGLLQTIWGRSFVGGCMYLVLKDFFRIYNKYRMAENKPLRRVRNNDKKSKKKKGGSVS